MPDSPPTTVAARMLHDLARQRREQGTLGPSFEVTDLHHVQITGPVDLIALARIAVEAAA